MSLNDENTRAAVRGSADQLGTLFAHFCKPDSSWQTFQKTDSYLEFLKLRLEELLHCVEGELQTRNAVEPTEYGT